jgi:hypothetical protein
MCTIFKINDIIYDIYVLSYNNVKRENNMIRRFEEVGTTANICRFMENDKILENSIYKTQHGCFLNHLTMIKEFYNNSSKEFGVFMENDIYLKKSLTKDLIDACNNMKILNFDVLSIGYLVGGIPEVYGFPLIHMNKLHRYYKYDNNLWGTQGFILTKLQAKHYIDKYTVEYILNPDTKEIIAADFIFTKQGNRALLYPPLVVEEGYMTDDNSTQVNFHKTCKEFLYNDSYTS